MKEFLDFISINPSTIIISIINLLILFLILKRFLFKPIKKIISEREEEVKEIYLKANANLNEGNELKTEYSERINNINIEKEQIISDAVIEAKQKSEVILSNTNEEVRRIKNDTDKELALKRTKMYKDMKDEVGDIAILIAEKVIEREVNADVHKELVTSFISNLENNYE